MRDVKQQIANANEIVSANAKAKEIVNAKTKTTSTAGYIRCDYLVVTH